MLHMHHLHPAIELQLAAFEIAERQRRGEAHRTARPARRRVRTWFRRSQPQEVTVRRLRPA